MLNPSLCYILNYKLCISCQTNFNALARNDLGRIFFLLKISVAGVFLLQVFSCQKSVCRIFSLKSTIAPPPPNPLKSQMVGP